MKWFEYIGDYSKIYLNILCIWNCAHLFIEYQQLLLYIEKAHKMINALYKDFDFGLQTVDGANLDGRPKFYAGKVTKPVYISNIEYTMWQLC